MMVLAYDRLLCIGLVAAAVSSPLHGGDRADLAHVTRLDELLYAYFTSHDAEKRLQFASAIDTEARGSVSAVVEALQTVNVWPVLPHRRGRLAFVSPAFGKIDIAYRLPNNYESSSRHPAILCFPDHGEPIEGALRAAVRAMGSRIEGFVLVAPSHPVGGSFHQPGGSAGDLPELMRELRRRIHLDTERVFLFGMNRGGDAAWIAALFHPDLFAGVITLASYPALPYADQTYPVLIRNLRRLPVVSLWVSPGDGDLSARRLAVAMHNRAITAMARAHSLAITGGEVPPEAYDGTVSRGQDLLAILDRRQPRIGAEFAHWFRYPQQGRAGWIRQVRAAGDVWEEEQLSILPSPNVDRDEFITGVIQGKMGYLAGRIDGQTIDIQAKHCSRIEVLLTQGLVDLGRPITVRCNGKKRFSGVVEADIAALLDHTYTCWDFQRPILARLPFSIKPRK